MQRWTPLGVNDAVKQLHSPCQSAQAEAKFIIQIATVTNKNFRVNHLFVVVDASSRIAVIAEFTI